MFRVKIAKFKKKLPTESQYHVTGECLWTLCKSMGNGEESAGGVEGMAAEVIGTGCMNHTVGSHYHLSQVMVPLRDEQLGDFNFQISFCIYELLPTQTQPR